MQEFKGSRTDLRLTGVEGIMKGVGLDLALADGLHFQQAEKKKFPRICKSHKPRC